jgi:hypothetical protein
MPSAWGDPEAVEMDLSRWSVAARAAVNAAYVVGCIIAMLIIVLGLSG